MVSILETCLFILEVFTLEVSIFVCIRALGIQVYTLEMSVFREMSKLEVSILERHPLRESHLKF